MRKVAFPADASSGIGKVCTWARLKKEWPMALVGRLAGMIEKALAEAGADSVNALVVPIDVTLPRPGSVADTATRPAISGLSRAVNGLFTSKMATKMPFAGRGQA
jgi:NADP-dependent 3-hydroxy acid dehydrogenase YdfG